MGNNPAPINQLHEPTVDGGPDEAAQENCVPASLAWILEDLVGGTFDGDEVRDAVYPEGYTGGTNIPAYAPYAAQHGVSLTPVYGDGAAMVAALHTAVSGPDDALVTIPSDWNAAPPSDPAHYPGYTHVCAVAYVLDSDHLRLMNPWGGVWMDVSNEWLAPRLCYGVVWTASKAAVPQESGMWTRNADQTATDSVGHHVGQGMADQIFAHGMASAEGLTGEEYYDADDSFAALSNGVVLHYSKQSNATDMNGAVVAASLFQQLASAKAALSAAEQQQQNPPVDEQAQAAKAALQQLKTVLAEV